MTDFDKKQLNKLTEIEDEPDGADGGRYRRLLNALEILRIMVIETDAKGTVLYANKPAKDYLLNCEGVNRDKKAEDAALELKKYLVNFLAEAREFPAFYEIQSPDKNTWLKVTSDRLPSEGGNYIYMHMIEDISDWKLYESELMISATVDELTGVYNRKAGLERLGTLLADKKISGTHCVAFLDVDNLKIINDKFGHNEGDYAIRSIAEVITSSVRASDTVFRYGGDEFIIVFKTCSEERASLIIDRMKKRLLVIDIESPKPYKLRFSYGIVTFKAHEYKNAEELIAMSDKKMYHYKAIKKLNAAL